MTWLAFLNWCRKNWLAILIAFAALGLYMLGRHDGAEKQEAKTAKVQAKFDAYKTEVQKAVAIRLTQNKIKEAEDRKVFAEIAEQYKKDIADAKAKGNRIAADLRAGNIKLRKQWQGCSTAAKGAADTGGVDENARLREESAGRIIGNAAEADSWITALQDGWKQCEKRSPGPGPP